MRQLALFALAGALALSACGKKEEDEAPVTNNLVEPPADLEPVNDTAPPPPPSAENVAEPAPPPQVSEDQQMIDDADATGLTARLPAGEEASADEPSGQVGSGE